MTRQITLDFLNFLKNAGEMGELVVSKDWSKSPLGSIKTWPQSLQTTVSLCLSSNFPISIIWGPQRIQIYNDAYRIICAGKHPKSMGQDFAECWASAWPVIGDAFQSALNGKASFLEDMRIILDRKSYLEETFFTFSFSPIHDENGEVVGLFHPVTEQTGRMLSERRTRALRDLTVKTSNAIAVEDVFKETVKALLPYSFDLPFFMLYRLNKDCLIASLAAYCGLSEDSPLFLSSFALDESRPWQLNAASFLQPITLIDLPKSFQITSSSPYDEPTTQAFFIPLNSFDGVQDLTFIIAGISPRLPLDQPYQDFFTMIAATISSSLTSAQANQENINRVHAMTQLDRAKTVFFSNVSHELRTPLTLVLGPLEDMLNDAELRLPDVQRNQIELAQRNANRLLKLVNSLLDFSRIEAGRVTGMFEPVDLGSMTAELASHFRSACDKVELGLRINCAHSEIPVYVDPEMWEKIILNLLSNAFKYTMDGNITISLVFDSASVSLHVDDTGIGIPKNELSRVFERFHRIEGQKGRTHEGTGIGLALVAELIKIHGGEIGVISEVNKGSQFTITLPLGYAHLPYDQVIHPQHSMPLVKEAQTKATKEDLLNWIPTFDLDKKSGNSELQDDTHKLRARIILADDNQDMRDYIRRILEKEGYWVDAVASGVDAIYAATLYNPIDLILTDVMMPELDGFGVLSAIRMNSLTQNIPVILVSARAGQEARIEGLNAGADEYIVKPFGARELLARIDSVIRLTRNRRDAGVRESHLKSEIQTERAKALHNENETKLNFASEAARLAKLAEVVLFNEKERLRVTLHSIGDGVITTDQLGIITYLNPAAEEMTGWTNNEASGLPLPAVFNIINGETGKLAPDLVRAVLRSSTMTGVTDNTILIKKTGIHVAINESAAPLLDGNTLIGVVLVFHDVSNSRDMAAKMAHQASHDHLTGLVNRREFERRLESAIKSGKEKNEEHSLLYLDLDQFKIVNDTCGHAAGDELLRILTTLMSEKLRQRDTLARLGGDEFGLLLENCRTEPAHLIAEELRKTVHNFHFFWNEKIFPVGVSIGLVTFSNGGVTHTDVLRMADAACYVAKEKGRNRIYTYTSEDKDLAQRSGEIGWISRLQEALDNDRFVLYAQKILSLEDHLIPGEHIELLLRMDIDGKIIAPMAFIPAAERYGLMMQIDRWVIANAFSRHSKIYPKDTICNTWSINLSGKSIGDPTLLNFILNQFEQSMVSPKNICFEITETAAISNLGDAANLIHSLRNIGCRISLDDFGSGMSSFSYLKHLPVDYLKIDGGFVKGLLIDPIDHAMVTSINNIGHVMGIKTIAEFVEDDFIMNELRQIGVDFAQGNGIEKPRPLTL